MRTGWGSVLLVLPLLLAGCSGGGREPSDITRDYFPDLSAVETDNGTQIAGPQLDVPTWRQGEFWTYERADGSTVTFVVTDELAGVYTIDTTDAQLAFEDARYDNDLVGPVRADDLATYKGQYEMLYFQWPLYEGHSWKTRHGFERLTVTARPLSDDLFEVRAVSDRTGVLYLDYTISRTSGWFETLRRVATDGTELYRYDLVEHGFDFQGDVFRWELDRLYDWRYDPERVGYNANINTTTGTDIYVYYDVDCSQGAVEASMNPVDPSVAVGQNFFRWANPCPIQGEGVQILTVPQGVKTEWVLQVHYGMNLATQGDIQFLFILRTLERIPIGPAPPTG